MAARKTPPDQHEFANLPAFDAGIRKIVSTPKAEVERREKEARKRRNRKK